LHPKPVNALQITDHVVINEVVANPNTGEIEWVELYNPTNSTVDMSGWRIRHNAVGNFSGVFASGTIIASHGFVVREKITSQALTNSGATLNLESDTNLGDIDTVTYPNLIAGQSYARLYDADSTFQVRQTVDVTKNASNGTPPVVNQLVTNFEESNSHFVGSPKYVRSNTAIDLDAAVNVPAPTTQVRFNFDGVTDINNVSGVEHIQAGQWPDSQGRKQFRVYASLPAGSYTVTAEFYANDEWHPVL
jgi:hypothetical protein